jgi:flavodoxin
MKYAVRYQSRGGNTRAVAEIIAGILGVEAEPIDRPLDENVDVLFVGGGVYMWHIDAKLKAYLETLVPGKVGKVVPFGTSGGQKVVIREITECAIKRGIQADEHGLYVQMWLKGHSALGLKGGKLNDKQIEKIKKFAKNIIQ